MNNTLQTDYNKLNKAEKAYQSDLAIRQQFLADNPYALRLEKLYSNDPIIQAQRVTLQKLDHHMSVNFKIYDRYRTSLQKKYKFEFPVECYGDGNFAEHFKQTVMGE